MLVEGLEQVQLGIFLDFHAQVVQALDGRVAGQEVQRPGAEADDLQILQAHKGAGDGDELVDSVGAVLCVAHGVFRYVGLDFPELQVIAGVEHAAVGVAAATHQVVAGFLRGGNEHGGTVKMLGQQGFGDFRAEVAQVHHQRVAAGVLHVFQRLHHMDFAFHNADGALVHALAAVFFGIGLHQGFSPVDGEGFRETVAGNGDDADLDFRGIVHLFKSSVS